MYKDKQSIFCYVHSHTQTLEYADLPYPINKICRIPQQPQAHKTHFSELMCSREVLDFCYSTHY